ncbi:MAG: undecaprenyl-diphosphate phosphatase [Planctomycetales bacterium]|nr:undecaprenyl-diphosphate phosphatase [Planctomycetales bacterium]
MSLWEIILLAIVQGLTEFLPVSSSGHLLVANRLLETLGQPPVADLLEVSIVLHLGTLAAVLVFYRREITRLFGSDRRVIGLLILGTIPAAVLGILLKKVVPEELSKLILENALLAGFMFPLTALLLVWSERRSPGEHDYPQLGWGKVFFIGMFQAVALLPGVSRSGATIAAGLAAGLQRNAAATFAFLLALPAIAGAGLLESLEIVEAGTTGTPLGTLATGFLVSMAVGLVALRMLISWVNRGRLSLFAYYLVPLGVVVIAWQLQ